MPIPGTKMADARAGSMRVPAALALATLAALLVGWSSMAPRRPASMSVIPIIQGGATNVTGTKWVGQDAEGRNCEYHFVAGGALHYKTRNGEFKNGRWKQKGTAIYMEMNNKYAEYNGVITGHEIKGTAHNIVGKRWTWAVKKKNADAPAP
jgi:hypothetical protein